MKQHPKKSTFLLKWELLSSAVHEPSFTTSYTNHFFQSWVDPGDSHGVPTTVKQHQATIPLPPSKRSQKPIHRIWSQENYQLRVIVPLFSGGSYGFLAWLMVDRSSTQHGLRLFQHRTPQLKFDPRGLGTERRCHVPPHRVRISKCHELLSKPLGCCLR